MKFFTTAILIIAIQITSPTESALSQSYTADDGYVEFTSSAPLLEFKGKSNNLTGLVDLDQNLVDFFVDLNTIDTGIERRNRDMRTRYLNTEQFPFAEFTGELTTPFDPDKREQQEVVVDGTFTIHGVEREIEVTGTLEPVVDGLKLEANWTVLLADHNIERPGILFYELAEEQEVHINIHLKKNN